MRKFILGLIFGVVLAVSPMVYASDLIQVSPFPAHFFFNGKKQELPSEYTVFNFEGHAYVPIRFITESMGERFLSMIRI